MSTETNETADLIRDAIGPQLGEFLDGYVLCGIKAGTRKKIIVVKMPKKVAASVEEYNKDGVPMGKDIDGYDHDMKPIRDTGKDLHPMIKSAEEWGATNIRFL
jgi:hypothetical protein